jgi:hypothetical protein
MNTAKEGAINVPTPAPAALPLAHESTVQDAADLYRRKGTYMDPPPIGQDCGLKSAMFVRRLTVLVGC